MNTPYRIRRARRAQPHVGTVRAWDLPGAALASYRPAPYSTLPKAWQCTPFARNYERWLQEWMRS